MLLGVFPKLIISYLLLSLFSFLATQPSFTTCLSLATAKAPCGTLSVIVDPVAIYPFSSTVTGATRFEFEPMNAPSLTTELNLFLEVSICL